MKRKLAVAAVAALAAWIVGGLLVLRTTWAAGYGCELAAARLREATGLEVAVGSCRFEPLALELTVHELRLGPAAAPVFAAEALRARLSALQLRGRQLELSELEVVRPRVVARLPASTSAEPGPCPPPVLRQFGIHSLVVREGSLDLTFPGGERLVAGRFEVRSASTRRGIAVLANVVGRRAAIDVAIHDARLERAGRAVEITQAYVDADVAQDLSRAVVHLASVELPEASLAATGTLEQLCRPRLDLAASLQGDLRSLLEAAGGAPPATGGRVAAAVSVTGTAAAPAIEGELQLTGVTLDGWRPGEATARFILQGSELRVDRLDVPMLGGRIAARAKLGLGRPIRMEAEATLRNVELAEIFSRLQLPGSWVMARVDGTTRVSGTVWPLLLTGGAGLEVTDFRVLDHGWERWRRGESAFLEFPRARVDAAVRIDPDGVRIESAQVRAGRGALASRAMLHFDDRGFEVSADGEADLDQLRHLGPMAVTGLARVEGAVVKAAPYGNPRIEGDVRIREAGFHRLDLGEVAAHVVYDRFILDVQEVAGRRGETDYQGALRFSLDGGARLLDGRYTARGRLRDLFEIAMPWQPGAAGLRDRLEAQVGLRGTAHGPVDALHARFEAELGRGELLGRGFEAGQVAGSVEEGARVVFEAAELRRREAVLRASGRIAFAAEVPWDLEGAFVNLPVRDLRLPGPLWTGALTGRATLRGSWDDPRLELNARGAGLELGPVPLGDASATIRLTGDELSAAARLDGVSVQATAQTTGAMPFHARAELDVPDALRFVPGASAVGLHARARGAATVTGALLDLPSARGELRLEEVRGGYAELVVENAEPATVSLQDQRLSVRPFTLRGPTTQLSLSGAREPSGALGLDARGSLDLRLLGGLFPAVVGARGQLQVEAHIAGTVSDPLVVGSGRLRDAGFQVRGIPASFAGLAGELSFSQNRVLFDGLAGTLNGGRAELDGELELVRLFPARLRVGVRLEEVPMRVPEWLPSVVTGRVQAAGRWDAMSLSGKLHVVRARYTEPVDLEKRLVEVQRRSRESKPPDRSGEWLTLDLALAVDGDVRVENDVARAGLVGDLAVTGTLTSTGLVGTLTTTPGSRGSFRGNEFLLTHGVIDFNDRHRIRMNLDVHGEGQVREYQVFLHLRGPYDDPALQLTTQPALTQQDIVMLLSLGYTGRDAATSGAVAGVATAAAAQALFTASGLDDQVRRFVPRGGLLRDFSVRITSAYSEGAGQVLPRAEFESKVLGDRLRLRYQAPLAGARGQRAQAEMRLGTHTSVQYQWDNDSPETIAAGGDHGLDLKLRWDWTE